MALQAYVDDSGGTDQNIHPYFVLAGLVSDTARWADFSTDWRAVLDLEPRLGYFKMSEAKALRKEFAMQRGWTGLLRDVRVAQLVEVIRSHAIFRVSVAIDKVAFYKHVASIKLKKPNPTAGDPYYLAFHQLVLGLPLRQAMNLPEIPQEGKIDFIFDQQGKTGTRASAAWDRLKSDVLPKMQMRGVPNILSALGSPPIFRDEKHFLPLQGADLFAWYMRRQRQRNRVLVAPVEANMRRLMEIPGDDALYDTSELLSVRYDVLETLSLNSAG